MPGGDRTGPLGMGPLTGRGAGYCAGFGVPGYMNVGFGRVYGRGFGRGFGRGLGRGWRWRAPLYGLNPYWGYASPPYLDYVPYSPYSGYGEYDSVLEKKVLENEARLVKEQLNRIEKRIAQLNEAQKDNKDIVD